MNKWPAIILLSLLITSCEFLGDTNREKNLAAEAYGRKLYEEDIAQNIGEFDNPLDSQFAASRYIDEWLMDVILYEEARSRVFDRKKIQELIRDYEQSLYIAELESSFVENELDTFVEKAEIDSFYLNHKDDFRLHESIIRVLYLKIPEKGLTDTLETLWKTEDLPALKMYANHHKGLALLNVHEWYSVSDLRSILPETLFNKISLKQPENYTLEENDQHFYLKVLEIIDGKEWPPVSFVKERIRTRIIQDRIKGLLKRRKSAIFKEKIESKEIKIYGKDNK